MKKLLCVLLILISVSAVFVPVFAATIFSVEYNNMIYEQGEANSKVITFKSTEYVPVGTEVKIKMVTSTDVSSFPFEVTTTDYTQSYTNGGTAFSYNFNMKCRNDAAAGYYTIMFNITISGDSNTYSLPVVVEVKANNTVAPSSMPRITITDFSTNPDPVVAGEEITLSVTFKNNTEGVTAKNVKAQLSSDGTFTPVSGSSSIFLGDIGGLGTIKKSIKLKVKADVAPNSYTVAFDLTYDVDGVEEQITDSETVSIPVVQVPKLQVSNPQMYPEEVYIGQDMNFMASLNNTGRSILYNVNVVFEDTLGCIEGQEQYIGNIEPGATKNIDVYLSAVMEGESLLTMTITYEDQDGEVYTFTESYDLYVLVRGDADPMPWPEEPENTGGGYTWIIIVVIVLLAAGGLAAFLFINRKKKAEQTKQIYQHQIDQWAYQQQQNMPDSNDAGDAGAENVAGTVRDDQRPAKIIYSNDNNMDATAEIPAAAIEYGAFAAEDSGTKAAETEQTQKNAAEQHGETAAEPQTAKTPESSENTEQSGEGVTV